MNLNRIAKSLIASFCILPGAYASGWTESSYNVTSGDVITDIGVAIIMVSAGASNPQVVPAATVQVEMIDSVTGTASGLSGGDPAWRADFATIVTHYSYGNNYYAQTTVNQGYIYYREALLYTVNGTNSFTRSSGSPTSASRSLVETSNNRPHTRLEQIPD